MSEEVKKYKEKKSNPFPYRYRINYINFEELYNCKYKFHNLN